MKQSPGKEYLVSVANYDGKVAEAEAYKRAAFVSVVVSTFTIAICSIILPWLYNHIQLVHTQLDHEMQYCMSQSSDLWRLYARTSHKQPAHERHERQVGQIGRWQFGRYFDSPTKANNARRSATANIRRQPVQKTNPAWRASDGVWSFGRFIPNSEANLDRLNLRDANTDLYGASGPDAPVQEAERFQQTGSSTSLSDSCCTCQQGNVGPPGAPGQPGQDGNDGQGGQMGPRGRDSTLQPGQQPPPCENTCEEAQPGRPGPAGNPGQRGPPGDEGPTVGGGTPGDPGRPGPGGQPGQRGGSGPPGFPGEPGIQREQPGPAGPPGPPGPNGSSGGNGPPGPQGNPAGPGPPGPPGDLGSGGGNGRPGGQGTSGGPGDRGLPGDCSHCPPARFPPGYFFALSKIA